MRSRLPSPIAGRLVRNSVTRIVPGGRGRVGERPAQQLLGRDDAHRDVALERGARAPCRDGATGCRDPVDLGGASASRGRRRRRLVVSHACSCTPERGNRSLRRVPSGPAESRLRLSDAMTAGARRRTGRARSSGPAPWCAEARREDRRAAQRRVGRARSRPVHGRADHEADARPRAAAASLARCPPRPRRRPARRHSWRGSPLRRSARSAAHGLGVARRGEHEHALAVLLGEAERVARAIRRRGTGSPSSRRPPAASPASSQARA